MTDYFIVFIVWLILAHQLNTSLFDIELIEVQKSTIILNLFDQQLF